MAGQLQGKKVAILVEEGFEEVELTSPREALEKAGAQVVVVSPKSGSIKSWKETDWGGKFEVDLELSKADAADFHALVLPGGVLNPDKLRTSDKAVAFVRAFFESQKPVAAICHGVWMLAEAGVIEGRRVTSYHSIKTDLINAGANWVDEEVVVDEGLVTSRNPDDLPAFNAKVVEEVGEGKHAQQHA